MDAVAQDQVFGQVLSHWARSTPEQVMFYYGGEPYPYSKVEELTNRVASGLLEMGLGKGDRIGIIGLNQPEWLLTYFAAARIGAVAVGLSVRYRDSELEYILNHSGARAVVTLGEFMGLDYVSFFDAFRSKIPTVTDFVFIGKEGFEGSRTFDDLLQSPARTDQVAQAAAAVTPDDLIMVIYTSGTTGRPKGAALTHRSQLASARAQAEHTQISPEDLYLLALPLNHVGGITCGVSTSMVVGGTWVLVPYFDADIMLDLYSRYPCTIVSGVPTMHSLIMLNDKFGQWRNRDRVRLVITGGSNADPALLQQLKDGFPNAVVMNLYGLSESSGAIVMSPWESDFDHTVRSIGKPIGDFAVRVADVKTGEVLPPGETGELCFRGQAVVPGYFDMPEETAAGFRDGWLHSGDLGYLDEDGYIVLMGRLKEMYIQGGFNVYPVEVENLLSRHPKVMMAAGIGVPDPVMGEVGRYYIVPKPGAQLTEEEIKAYCREHLADYKIPKQVVFRQELPLTPVGKIMKAALKEQFLKEGE